MTGDWHARWREGRIGFHNDAVHADLLEFGERFLGGGPHRVFVPLCGKTVDLPWLVSQGNEVVAVEMVEQAVEELHADHGIDADVAREGPFAVYRSPGMTVFAGDFFDLRPEHVGQIDRIWDRAALVALSPRQRPGYVERLRAMAGGDWTMLLNALEYDTSVMDGPPFSVPEAEVRGHYGDLSLDVLQSRDRIAEVARWRAVGHQYWIGTTYLIRSE